jgi:ABC-type multidrug transport system permease subunit
MSGSAVKECVVVSGNANKISHAIMLQIVLFDILLYLLVMFLEKREQFIFLHMIVLYTSLLIKKIVPVIQASSLLIVIGRIAIICVIRV